jgi:hypothetical protein
MVVDTNIPVIANGESKLAADVELACVMFLRSIARNGRISVDAGGLIFSEYRRNLRFSGQPRPGDAFLVWFNDHHYDASTCTRVALTELADGNFAEFPNAAGLAGFDPSDRKFVAVACADTDGPPIAVGLDRGWRKHKRALANAGVVLHFVCS